MVIRWLICLPNEKCVAYQTYTKYILLQFEIVNICCHRSKKLEKSAKRLHEQNTIVDTLMHA